MNERIRELFEEKVFPSFNIGHGLRRKPNGEYVSDALEDHWQTFQEGFELAVIECANYAREFLLEKADRSYLIHKEIKKHFEIE